METLPQNSLPQQPCGSLPRDREPFPASRLETDRSGADFPLAGGAHMSAQAPAGVAIPATSTLRSIIEVAVLEATGKTLPQTV